MAHDVFVSYSAVDKAAADAVVAGLEQDGLRCWIAPRDVLAGTSWGEAIVDAIEAARVMVLILSDNSNRSKQVLREVERAVASETIILPFRIEAIDPTGAMAYFLATEHWLDALTPPLERHIGHLAASIRRADDGRADRRRADGCDRAGPDSRWCTGAGGAHTSVAAETAVGGRRVGDGCSRHHRDSHRPARWTLSYHRPGVRQ